MSKNMNAIQLKQNKIKQMFYLLQKTLLATPLEQKV